MADPIVIPTTRILFPYLKWSSQLPKLRLQFRENQPYPHVHLKKFLDDGVAGEMAGEFPDMATDAWTHYKHQNENKLGLAKRSLFPPLLGEVVDELNSEAFVHWLSQLTGIPNRIARRRRPAPVGCGRIPERAHRFQQSPLPQALAAAGKPDSLSQPQLAGAMGRRDRAVGSGGPPVRREDTAAVQ